MSPPNRVVQHALLLSLLCLTAAVARAQTPLPELTQFGANISAGYERQSFPHDDGDIYSLIVSPYYASGDWLFVLDLPWYRLEGTTTQIRRPNFGGVCNALANNGGTGGGAGNNPGNGRIPPGLQRKLDEATEVCGPDTLTVETDDEQGLGDISVLASFGRPLDAEGLGGPLAEGNWFGALSGGYIADNADIDGGLGTGTRDFYIEGFLSGDFDHFSTSLSAGYNTVLGGELESFYGNYFYTSLELSTPRQQPWVVGANTYFQQADLADTDNISKYTLFAEWEATETITLRLDHSRYGSGDFYPDDSTGATLYFSF